jgi:outer membrane protein assembly factor BamB
MTDFTRRGFVASASVAAAGVAGSDAAAASEIAATTDWPMARRDAANTGVLPDVRAPRENLGVTWSQSFDADLAARPVLFDATLYAGTDDGTVVALDATTGSVEWRYDANSADLGSSLAATDDHVYVGTMPADAGGPGEVHAVRRADGSRAWRRETDRGVETPPTVVDDTVVVATEGGRTLALAAADGSVRWSWDGDQAVLAAPAVDADSGTVVVRGDGGETTALDLATGDRQWVADWSLYAPTCAPAVRDGRVHVGGYDDEQGHLYARDVASGDPAWHRTFDGPVVAAPAVADDRLYVHDGVHVHALDPATGDDAWRVEAGARGSVAVAGETVYATEPDDGIRTLAAASGAEHGRFTPDAAVDAFPLPADGGVFVATGDGRMLALAEGAGSRRLMEFGAVGGVAALGVAGYAAYRRRNRE